MSTAEAKAALRAHVERVVPESERAELSRLTAGFVAAVVRDERAKAQAQLRAAMSIRDTKATLESIFGGFAGAKSR